MSPKPQTEFDKKTYDFEAENENEKLFTFYAFFVWNIKLLYFTYLYFLKSDDIKVAFRLKSYPTKYK